MIKWEIRDIVELRVKYGLTSLTETSNSMQNKDELKVQFRVWFRLSCGNRSYLSVEVTYESGVFISLIFSWRFLFPEIRSFPKNNIYQKDFLPLYIQNDLPG